MEIKLETILQTITKDHTKSNVKTSQKKVEFKPDEVRKLFLQRMNHFCLKDSFGKRGLQLDDENKRVIELMCQYINHEPEFEKDDKSLNKGILLIGNFGSGKTLIMKTYKDVQMILRKKQIGFQTGQDMNFRFQKVDVDTGKPQLFDGIKAFDNIHDKTERIFDEIGAEETTIQNYGNKFSVMVHILNQRHKGIAEGCMTHGTTNLSLKQLSDKYGGRINSRSYEMFNVIILGGAQDSIDYRKK